jgi:uncharacterized protein involved in response to NO
MVMSVPSLRPYFGPALLSYGFRPFFLLAAIYAGTAVLLWLPMFHGELAVPTAFVPRDWHAHEMIYGYVAAVIAGFLLTAIPNWTGRPPLQGIALVCLSAIWIAGRVAVALSGSIGWLAAAVVDVAFLVLLAAAAVREIAAGRDWRNLKILVVLAVLIAANVVFHLEAHLRGAADYGMRLGLSAIIMLLATIGGRIVPNFTHNWLARENPGRMPISLATFDRFTLAVSAIALLSWIAMPASAASGFALIAAGVVHAVRLGRWAGDRTWRNRLVLVLHLAYAFVPIGFVLTGLAALGLVLPSAGIHAWTVGAIGTMTLAVMTRASLGHTGHALVASVGTQAIYAAVLAAAAARIAAALEPQWSDALLHVSAFCWTAAFFGFGIGYGPMLFRVGEQA